jgi:hypothetical protein
MDMAVLPKISLKANVIDIGEGAWVKAVQHMTDFMISGACYAEKEQL